MRLNFTDNFEIQRARNYEILFYQQQEYIPLNVQIQI